MHIALYIHALIYFASTYNSPYTFTITHHKIKFNYDYLLYPVTSFITTIMTTKWHGIININIDIDILVIMVNMVIKDIQNSTSSIITHFTCCTDFTVLLGKDWL